MFPQSVQIGDETGFFATGTVVGPNTVLTCAHCADGGFLVGGGVAYQSHSNQFRTLTGAGTPANPRTFGAATTGLAIIHPNYDFLNVGVNDMTLIISPSAIALPGGAAPAVILPPNLDFLSNGNVITYAGFGGAASLPAPPANSPLGSQQDRLRGSTPISGLTANQISFSVTNPPGMAGPNDVATQYTEPGDSGAGYFVNLPLLGPVLVGVHNAGNSRGLATNPNLSPIVFSGARLSSANFSSFAAGNGVSATDRTGLVINWNINGNGNFNTNNWTSGVATINTPATGHVAVISRPAANPTVTVTADLPLLYGLVNDDTLNILGGNLRVTHTARAAGVLNGANGTINVQALRELETTALDNIGSLTVNAGGRLTARTDSFNSGTLAITGNAARGDFSGPNGLRNNNAVNITARGSLQTTRYLNLLGATTTVNGGLFTALNDTQNAGTFNLTGGNVILTRDFVNSGMTSISNGAGLVGQFFANDDTTNLGTIQVNAGAIATFRDTFVNGRVVGATVTPGTVSSTGIAGGVPATPARIVYDGEVTNNAQSTITANNGSRIDFNRAVTNRNSADGTQPARILATGRNGGTSSTINFNDTVNSGNFVGDFFAQNGGRLAFSQSLTIGRRGSLRSTGTNGGTASTVAITGDLEVKQQANASVSGGGTLTSTNLIVAPPVGASRGGVVNVSGAGSTLTTGSTDNGGLIEILNTATATLGNTKNRRGATIVNKGTLTSKLVQNDGRFRKDPSLTIVEDDFEFGNPGTIDGDGQLFLGGNWINRSNQRLSWDMSEIDLIFDDDPLNMGGDDPAFNTALLLSPSRDIFDPTFPGPVLFLDSLSLFAGDDSFTSTLDVRGGRVYIEGDLTSLANFDMQPGTSIIDSLNPLRSLFGGPDPILRTTSFLPSNNYAIRSVQLAGQDLVFLDRYIIPEPASLVILIVALTILSTRQRRQC